MSNKKRIPKSPGGQLVCSDEQMAIVEIRNGEVFAECHDQPSKVRKAFGDEQARFLMNWALERITGEERSLGQSISAEEFEILQSEHYEYTDSRGNEVIVEFRLPRTQASGGTATF
ncbi:hypothetical protein LA6_006423 (plasmid) [Marinibacterium anthonyi]|nr:hypothetical protein LA6_006423 [Marinibacterium anthonyi]